MSEIEYRLDEVKDESLEDADDDSEDLEDKSEEEDEEDEEGLDKSSAEEVV